MDCTPLLGECLSTHGRTSSKPTLGRDTTTKAYWLEISLPPWSLSCLVAYFFLLHTFEGVHCIPINIKFMRQKDWGWVSVC